jgi:hypothetical protein
MMLAIVMLFTIGVSIVAAVAGRGTLKKNPADLSNMVGPTALTLLQGHGLVACNQGMGTPGNTICYHSGRMPMASAVVALAIRLVGVNTLRIDLFKILLLLIPLEASIVLAWRRVPADRARAIMTAVLLMAPFAIVPFIADVINLQVEEGYTYSLLAFAASVLFFGRAEPRNNGLWKALVFGLTADAIYLAKSSMSVAVAVLVIAFLVRERRLQPRVVVLLLAILAPVGWAGFQHHSSGRYSFGTSLDGMNLHKSNNEGFLDHYPPRPGTTLDPLDVELNRGHFFQDEWSFNDFHQAASLAWLRTHPAQALEGDGRKLWVMFFSLRKIGSTESSGRMLVVETAGLVLARIIVWIAVLAAVWLLLRGGGGPDRAAAVVFLALTFAVALPYLIGFAYTRHISVLIYPAALFCCLRLQRGREVFAE